MSDTKREEIARPSPVPPYSLVVEVSACSNSEKMSFCFSRGMPMPESITWKINSTPPSKISEFSMTSLTEPCWVNFKALITRFTITCRKRVRSPMMKVGTSEATSRISSMFFSILLKASERRVSPSASFSSKRWFSSSIFPASILEKSNMSLINPSKDSAEC